MNRQPSNKAPSGVEVSLEWRACAARSVADFGGIPVRFAMVRAEDRKVSASKYRAGRNGFAVKKDQRFANCSVRSARNVKTPAATGAVPYAVRRDTWFAASS